MASIFFDTSTQLAASATYTGGAGGTGSGTNMVRDATLIDNSNRFGAQANSDQTGTLYIEGSFDQIVWRRAGSIALATPGTPVDLDVPVRFRYYRVVYVNGATQTGAGNFSIHSSFRSGQ